MNLEGLGLSPTQKRAFSKLLRTDEWQTAKWWDERKQTLDSLVRLGIAIKDGDKYKRKFKIA